MAIRKNANRIEYEKRVNRVIDYIVGHMSEELSLEKLADVAAFSPYHFHRVFKSITGENLNEFIQRVRIERSASHLINSPLQGVLEVALEHGFNSAASFARVFKRHFGMSATQWRDGGAEQWSKIHKVDRKVGKQVRKAREERGDPTWENASIPGNGAWDNDAEARMNVKVKELATYHVAYMRHVGPYGEEIALLWGRFVKWAMPRGLWPNGVISLGIAHDDPRVTAPEKCRYDACVAVPKDFTADRQVNIADLPGGKYATFEFIGTPQEIGPAWDQLFSEWLPNSGFQPDNRPCFELYAGDHSAEVGEEVNDPKTMRFKCEICIPVKPL
jgi:AraC family transcriptional regulator